MRGDTCFLKMRTRLLADGMVSIQNMQKEHSTIYVGGVNLLYQK